MKRALLTLACFTGLTCIACEAQKTRVEQRSEPPVTQLFLNEPFRVDSGEQAARCRVVEASQLLAEGVSLPYPQARVRPDVPAVDISLSCESAQGTTIPSRDALPLDTVVLLVRGTEERAARPTPDADARDHLLFEVPGDREGFLPAVRRFDTDTGRPVLAHERSLSKVRFKARSLAVEIILRQRLQDAALDTLLDELIAALTARTNLARLAADAKGEAALVELAATYTDVRNHFRPARLSLTQVAGGSADALQITLSLSRPRAHANTFEVGRFELSLARQNDGSLRVRSFDNRAAARIALECGALEEKLRDALRDVARTKQADMCNALGTLLPASCNDVDAGLLSRALEVGARCGSLFHEAPQSKTRLPEDFQLTMRRGRTLGGLDRSPRYVVALFHQGQVVFHGKHWVNSQERSDGRTLIPLLAGLYDHVRRLDWFERRGGHYDPEGCSPSDDLGDVITVRAGDRERMVLQRDGCRGPFSEVEITDLRRHVELVAGLSGWTEPRPSYIDEDVEHWAIAE